MFIATYIAMFIVSIIALPITAIEIYILELLVNLFIKKKKRYSKFSSNIHDNQTSNCFKLTYCILFMKENLLFYLVVLIHTVLFFYVYSRTRNRHF